MHSGQETVPVRHEGDRCYFCGTFHQGCGVYWTQHYPDDVWIPNQGRVEGACGVRRIAIFLIWNNLTPPIL
jgi:hypothetical protein